MLESPTILAAAPPGIPFSPVILLTLLTALAASALMYWMLVRRWTSRRQWVSLAEWARINAFRLARQTDLLPPPFDAVGDARVAVRLELLGEHESLLQLQPEPQAPPDARAPVLNALVRKIESDWPPSGFRPVGSAASVLDLFSLGSFPLMGTNQRFVVYGADSTAARTLAQSSVRSLLPQDVGLLIHGRYVVLDFSTRPFDSLEFTRMRALAEQIVAHLPPLKAAAATTK